MKPCLVIIDGWGLAGEGKHNAIANAKTPFYDTLCLEYPILPLNAHGLAVGLPEGQMGNSEVGHLNIGAGRVVYQDIVRINLAIKNKKLLTLPPLQKLFQEGNGRLHLLGIFSDGGVHGHLDHLIELIKAAKESDVENCYIHGFTDGRDTAPMVATKYVKKLQEEIKKNDYGELATLMGRYYAMDRDNRWERIALAVEALINGKGERAENPLEKLLERYKEDETDEFLRPIILSNEGRIKEGDSLLFFNYRPDRMRQICSVFLGEQNITVPNNLKMLSMTQYKSTFPIPVLFPKQTLENTLAEWLEKNNKTQFHCAETEKYAHVTFFFNGRREEILRKETWKLINSPRVDTYDLQPEMSVLEVANAMAEVLGNKKFDFLVCNFAPPDMVGHTGSYEAALLAVEATDRALKIVFEACQRNGYLFTLTSDHGNIECMGDLLGGPHKAHTTAQVPFLVATKNWLWKQKIGNTQPALCDVAPTLLDMMGLAKPDEMEGSSLVVKK